MTDKALQKVRDAEEITKAIFEAFRGYESKKARLAEKTIQTALKLLEEKIQEQRGELKPCPFCKKEARSWRQGFIGFRLVACSDGGCGAYFTKFTPSEWNTRPTDRLVQEFIEGVE